MPIHAREAPIYQVPIPQELRGQGDEFDIRIEVTLSYVAQPRRTRRNLRRYLSTWADWKSRETKRNNGTVQKDWAVVKSNTLPKDFCLAVVGHEGWSRDPDSEARYSIAVTLEILGQEIAIYEPLRTAVIELQELETEIENIEEEVEVEVEE